MVWLRDLNCHYPLWESDTNQHLDFLPNMIQPLLDLLGMYDMDLALPPGIPIYETCAGNWTHSNNVWISHLGVNLVTSCDTTPQIHPPNADHLPIIMTIDLSIPQTEKPPMCDFCGIDFNNFNKALKTNLAGFSPPPSPPSRISTKADFESVVFLLTSSIQQTIC